ncbi:MAG: 2Fe-2S iron-sulfur cluster-binding protein, partial [Pseudomonadota bacterium]
MSQRISISRAARLVGVKRGVLQQKVRSGELRTFEGEIALEDLLQAYPNASIEDQSMLEKVSQIMDQAHYFTISPVAKNSMNKALASRILNLSRELSDNQSKVRSYRRLLRELKQKLQPLTQSDDSATSTGTQIVALLDWVEAAENEISDSAENDASDSLANEVYLKVMTAQAKVQPSGHEFFIEGADSILEAGLRGGLGLNYGCSNGNCGLCKIRVLSGEVRPVRHHDYCFTEAEKNQGYVLACSCTAVTDIVLEADEARDASEIPEQSITARIKKVDCQDGEVILLSLQTPRTNRLRFLAGQNAGLSLEDGAGFQYPIASCPCD